MDETDMHYDEVRVSRANGAGSGSIDGMIRSATEKAGELNRRLDLGRRIQENPVQTIAIAFGIGYVLGGGLFSRFTGTLVRYGMRAALLPAVKYAVGDQLKDTF